jgi:hypothetical protein
MSKSYDKLQIGAFHDVGYKLRINDRLPETNEVVRSQFLKRFRRFIKSYPDRPPIESLPFLNRHCPFCRTPLIIAEHYEHEEDEHFVYAMHVGSLEYCTNCHHWQWHYLESDSIDQRGVFVLNHSYTSYLSKIREFTLDLPEGFSTELAQWIRRNQSLWHSINPYKLEMLVADIFKANYSKAEVIHVGKPDDAGVDVLFIDTSGHQWLIQVKRRERPEHAEGIETIRNLLGAMVLQRATYGIVVSTADHFTYRAYQAVGRAQECGMTVELVDRKKLERMLDPVMPDRPWLKVLDTNFPDFAERFAEKIPSTRQLKLF